MLVITVAMLIMAGCATSPTVNDVNDAAASIPSGRSPLSGTWHGSAYQFGASAGFYSADCSLRINDDGTWTWTQHPKGGAAVEYSSTSTVRGNRVLFSEANSQRSIELRQSAGRLYGLANVDGLTLMFEFTRLEQ
jgi:hypothetical protein